MNEIQLNYSDLKRSRRYKIYDKKLKFQFKNFNMTSTTL